MKKITLLSAITLLLAMNCLAQDRGYVAVSIGAGIPVGDFGDTDLNNDSSAFVKTGGNFEISYAQKFGKHLGITALIRQQSLPTDTEKIRSEFEKTYPGVKFGVNSDSWAITNVMGGGYGTFPINSQVSFESRIMLGLMIVNAPEMTITGTQPGSSPVWSSQESASGAALSYLIGAGLKYNVGKRICLLANIDFVNGNANFIDVKMTNSDGDSEVKDLSQTVSTVNLGFGVGYRL